MKQKLVVMNNDSLVIYEGKPLDIPIYMEAIRKKSVELFNDPDPCIIHQSYAIHQLVMPLIKRLKKNEPMKMKDLMVDLSWIDLPQIDECSILLKG